MDYMLVAGLALVGMFLLVVLLYYNGFVAKRNRIEQAESTIDVMLKKRNDLVPSLVATVQAAMRHEADVLTRIAALRERAAEATDAPARRAAGEELGKQLEFLMARVEQYPELKANQALMGLQYSLNEIEAQLAASRRFHNAAITDYNDSVEMFPGKLVAGAFSFRRRDLPRVTPKEREAAAPFAGQPNEGGGA